MKIDFKLGRRIGALNENPSGYTKELNVVIWDEKYTKYDLPCRRYSWRYLG